MEIFETFFGGATFYYLFCFVSTDPAQTSSGGVYGIKPRWIVARSRERWFDHFWARIRNLHVRTTRLHTVYDCLYHKFSTPK